MAKVKKIYKYVDRLVKPCLWCEGTGWDKIWNDYCSTCKGTGGEWKRVPVLVGKEVEE